MAFIGQRMACCFQGTAPAGMREFPEGHSEAFPECGGPRPSPPLVPYENLLPSSLAPPGSPPGAPVGGWSQPVKHWLRQITECHRASPVTAPAGPELCTGGTVGFEASYRLAEGERRWTWPKWLKIHFDFPSCVNS